jgi:predicted ATPase/DNA-binding winged helix-turn-helix (wHTH) protein
MRTEMLDAFDHRSRAIQRYDPPVGSPVHPRRGSETMVRFGGFRLDQRGRELHSEAGPVTIGGRALDILIVLIEANGGVVSKDELISRVWSGAIVEENTIHAQISALRKALRPECGLIKAVFGRGYQFIGKIEQVSCESGPASRPSPPPLPRPRDASPPTNLQAAMSDLIGREAQLLEVADLVTSHRLTTLVGAGGIGKTRLSLELGRCLLPRFADGVWVVELGALSDPDLVLPTLATTLGLADPCASSAERLAAALASKQILLILDNCEHVIDATAGIAEAFLRSCASSRMIATSREPLRVEGERVYAVPPLDVPTEDIGDLADILRKSAVRLFIERAGAVAPLPPLDGRIGASIAKICRYLDGNPLAIELAAARTAAFDVDGIVSRLDDGLGLLTNGRRTAPARHRTLRAALDWSYELLPRPERMVLRRLPIFTGDFTMEAASMVLACGQVGPSEVAQCLFGLVTKSLLVADISNPIARFRLPEITRAYALEKLRESGEFDQVALRLAKLNESDERDTFH